MRRTRQVFDRTDVGLIVVDAGQWGPFEEATAGRVARRGRRRSLVVFNKIDLRPPAAGVLENSSRAGVPGARPWRPRARRAGAARAVGRGGAGGFPRRAAIVADLVPPGEMAVLVVPIDLEAPKGRLIVPQVQAIRDLLDGDAYCLVVKERELRDALGRLNRPPALVVTDSQAFLKVAADTPPEVQMTSFSILFARQKGDLRQFVAGPWPSTGCGRAIACWWPRPARITPSATTSAG